MLLQHVLKLIFQLFLRNHYDSVTFCFCYFDHWCNAGSHIRVSNSTLAMFVVIFLWKALRSWYLWMFHSVKFTQHHVERSLTTPMNKSHSFLIFVFFIIYFIYDARSPLLISILIFHVFICEKFFQLETLIISVDRWTVLRFECGVRICFQCTRMCSISPNPSIIVSHSYRENYNLYHFSDKFYTLLEWPAYEQYCVLYSSNRFSETLIYVKLIPQWNGGQVVSTYREIRKITQILRISWWINLFLGWILILSFGFKDANGKKTPKNRLHVRSRSVPSVDWINDVLKRTPINRKECAEKTGAVLVTRMSLKNQWAMRRKSGHESHSWQLTRKNDLPLARKRTTTQSTIFKSV